MCYVNYPENRHTCSPQWTANSHKPTKRLLHIYTKPQTHTEILTRPLDRNWCKWPFQNKRAVYYSTFLSFLAFQLEVINNYFKCESRSPVSDDPDDRPTITHAVLIEYTIAASALQLSNGKLQFSVRYSELTSWCFNGRNNWKWLICCVINHISIEVNALGFRNKRFINCMFNTPR